MSTRKAAKWKSTSSSASRGLSEPGASRRVAARAVGKTLRPSARPSSAAPASRKGGKSAPPPAKLAAAPAKKKPTAPAKPAPAKAAAARKATPPTKKSAAPAPAPKKPAAKAVPVTAKKSASSSSPSTPAARKPTAPPAVIVKVAAAARPAAPATAARGKSAAAAASAPATKAPAAAKSSPSKGKGAPGVPSAPQTGAGDRSQHLRRLLEVRNGFQRAARPGKPSSVVTRPVTAPPTHPPVSAGRPKPKLLQGDAERLASRVLAAEKMIAAEKAAAKPPAKPTLARKDLEELRNMLLDEREKVRHDLDTLDDISQSQGENGGPAASAFSIHIAEHATDSSALETTLMQRHLIEERLTQVEDALQRIQAGNYGVCDMCGNPINLERLLAKPFARVCIDCRRQIEKKRPGMM